MILKGYTLYGTLEDVRLEDCPIYLKETELALIGKDGSPLIKAKSLIRMDEETGLREGDKIIEDGSIIGCIVYAKGFKMQTWDKCLKDIPAQEHIQVEDGDEESVAFAVSSPWRTPIEFYYRGRQISIADFLCKVGSYIATANDRFNGRKINPAEIEFITGYEKPDGSPICFGEFYQGGIITLHNGIPAVFKDDEYVEINTQK